MWHSHYHYFPWGFGWGFMLLALVPYFLPTIIAIARRKNSVVGVFLLNFFLGWTLIGWIGALIWAMSSDRQPMVIVNNPPPPPYSAQSHSYTNVTVKKPGAPTQQEKIDQLRQLKQLFDEGALTEAEFNRQKAAILG
jgi:T4 superinfection immunity protein/putative oligomerization/nucleic acid binding protein